MSKRKALLIHAKGRAEERYGIKLSPDLHKILVGKIQNGVSKDARFVQRESSNRTKWIVRGGKYKQEWLPVVYDSSSQTIVTVFPKESLAKFQNLISGAS